MRFLCKIYAEKSSKNLTAAANSGIIALFYKAKFPAMGKPIEHHYTKPLDNRNEYGPMKTIPSPHRRFLAVLGIILAFATGTHAQTSDQTTVSILATDRTALAGTSTGAFTLVRNGPTNADLSVNFTISGTASNGVDYNAITNPVTIPAGYYAVDIPVVPIVDPNVSGNTTVILTLQTDGSYAIGRPCAKVKIIDDIFNLPPPTIDLLTPTNGSVFDTPASIVLTPDISDTDTQVVCITFYANDECIGKTTNSPFTFTWNTCRPGSYCLFARAVDSLGRSALSTPVQISISNIVPEVTITNPVSGSEFTEGTNITVGADATDAATNITEVDFYANHHFIGSATTSPYAITWSNVPAGKFKLEAVAVDQNGKRGCSQPVQIRVIATPPPPSQGKHHANGQKKHPGKGNQGNEDNKH